jgi:hypothetical protein
VSIQDIDTFVREYLNTSGSQLDSDSRAEVRDTSGNQRVFVVSSSQESQIASITGFPPGLILPIGQTQANYLGFTDDPTLNVDNGRSRRIAATFISPGGFAATPNGAAVPGAGTLVAGDGSAIGAPVPIQGMIVDPGWGAPFTCDRLRLGVSQFPGGSGGASAGVLDNIEFRIETDTQAVPGVLNAPTGVLADPNSSITFTPAEWDSLQYTLTGGVDPQWNPQYQVIEKDFPAPFTLNNGPNDFYWVKLILQAPVATGNPLFMEPVQAGVGNPFGSNFLPPNPAAGDGAAGYGTLDGAGIAPGPVAEFLAFDVATFGSASMSFDYTTVNVNGKNIDVRLTYNNPSEIGIGRIYIADMSDNANGGKIRLYPKQFPVSTVGNNGYALEIQVDGGGYNPASFFTDITT